MKTTDLTPRTRLRFGAVGATVIGACLVASFVAARETHPGAHYLRATFGRAGEGLDTRSDVKIRGVKVGGVASVRLTADGRAQVTIRLDHGVRAPASTEAAVVPLSVFGPKYIDLRPGQGEGTGPYLADGGTIAKTQDPQELTDVAEPTTRLFDALNPRDIATIMTALGGIDGRGQEMSRLMDDSSKLLGLGARRSADLGAVLDNGGKVAGTVADHSAEIGPMTADLDTVLTSVTGDPARFETMLNGISGSARTLVQILGVDPRAPGRIIDSIGPVATVLHTYRGYFPDLISGSSNVLTQLTGIARAPGPHKTLLSRVTIHINPNEVLCETLPGICGPIPPAIPQKPPTGTKRGGD
ncbi:MCE family protein [Actinomadura barringtoniae]|uniref:MCE family protein n=1 Tax=Actinomadura barringtoniae TaxID=1427535 RepID=A0A939P891_9ACTN|nr:MlaD family protein [Actinomadura barringtoniae]MBO2447686.1 MCE family protein [Actinomadura barringtoniae]